MLRKTRGGTLGDTMCWRPSWVPISIPPPPYICRLFIVGGPVLCNLQCLGVLFGSGPGHFLREIITFIPLVIARRLEAARVNHIHLIDQLFFRTHETHISPLREGYPWEIIFE